MLTDARKFGGAKFGWEVRAGPRGLRKRSLPLEPAFTSTSAKCSHVENGVCRFVADNRSTYVDLLFILRVRELVANVV